MPAAAEARSGAVCDDPQGLLQQGVAAHQAGDLAAARALYQRVLAIQPGNADALHLLGVTEYQSGALETAVGTISAAIAANPRAPVYYNNLGLALRDLGRLQAARESFRRGLALDPYFAEAYCNLAGVAFRQGLVEEALLSCRQAITLKPDYPDAHLLLGDVLRASGRLEEATACYGRALALAPHLDAARQAILAQLQPGDASRRAAEAPMHGVYLGDNRVLVRTVTGMRLLAPADDISITPLLLAEGYLELPLTRCLPGMVTAGQTVVDVGANIGYFTVQLAGLVGRTGRVLAYEPQPLVHAFAAENVQINYVSDRVELSPLAVHSAAGTVALQCPERSYGSASTNGIFGGGVPAIDVPSAPLDELLAGIERVELVKIDVEGAERHVLAGMRGLLERHAVGTIVFEVNRVTLAAEWQPFADLLHQYERDFGLRFAVLNELGVPAPISLDELLTADFYPFALAFANPSA